MSSWQEWKLSHVFQVVGSGTTPDSDNHEYYDGGIPWVTTSELRETIIEETAQTVTKQALKDFSALRLYPRGSLLVAMYGATVGRLGILGLDSTVNQACCVFAESKVAVTRFVFYALLAKRAHLINLTSGGGQPNLSQSTLRSVKVALPSSVDAQQMIADFLDRETARIDDLVAKKQRLLELIEEKRRAEVTLRVTQGLRSDVPMRDTGVDYLGRIPKSWTMPTLYARYWVALGKMLDSRGITGVCLLPYLRNVDVQWDHINAEDLPQMDISPDEYDRFLLKEGDLLVCEGGEVGRCAVWNGTLSPCAYQKALHRMRPIRADEHHRTRTHLALGAEETPRAPPGLDDSGIFTKAAGPAARQQDKPKDKAARRR